MESFGEIIRKAREEKNYILRHVGAELDIDQASSKEEKENQQKNK